MIGHFPLHTLVYQQCPGVNSFDFKSDDATIRRERNPEIGRDGAE